MRLLAAALLATGCGGQNADGSESACVNDLPADFVCQRSLKVEQSQCSGNATGTTLAPHAHWSTDGKSLHIEEARFRCNQSVCAYLDASSDAAKILLQPCEMSPSTVTRCDCGYSFDVPVALPEAVSSVSVELRSDAYGGEPTSRALGTLSVGASAKLCDGSTALRFAAHSGGGNLSGLPPFLSELGWSLLLIDGQCRYYAMTAPDREIRTGTLNDADALSFSQELSLGAWQGLPQSRGCPDASVQSYAFGADRTSVSCESTPLSQAHDAWLERLYDAGSPVDGPVRYWVIEPSNEQWPDSNPAIALPYPLAGAPAATSRPFEPGNPLVASDPGDAAKLRALRAEYQATPPATLGPQYSIPVVLGTPERSSVYYDLSLRDTVPFEIDGALAIEAFLE
jgi:hypothetical protein